jgi:hypothetical protein
VELKKLTANCHPEHFDKLSITLVEGQQTNNMKLPSLGMGFDRLSLTK